MRTQRIAIMEQTPLRKKRWILVTASYGAIVYSSLAVICFIGMLVPSTGKFYNVLFALTMPLIGFVLSLDFSNEVFFEGTMFISPAILGAFVFVSTRFLWRYIQTRSVHLADRKKLLVNFGTAICLFLAIGSPMLLQKTSMRLSFKNKKIGVLKNSLLPFDKTRVYIGNKKMFSLYNGSGCEYPMFVHPLDEGARILCICANDTEDLVFVVDLNGSNTNTSTNLFWAPYIVMDSDALVRLPTQSELSETLDWLENSTAWQYRNTCLPRNDFGLFRIYAGKNEVHYLLSNAPLSGSGVQPWISDMPSETEVLGL